MIKKINTTNLRTVNKRVVAVASSTTMMMTTEKEAKMSLRTTTTDFKFLVSGCAHEISYYFNKHSASLEIEIKRIYVQCEETGNQLKSTINKGSIIKRHLVLQDLLQTC